MFVLTDQWANIDTFPRRLTFEYQSERTNRHSDQNRVFSMIIYLHDVLI